MDGLSEKVDKSKDTIDEKLAKIEEDLSKKANRYIIPMALVVLTGLVLGAFAILAA